VAAEVVEQEAEKGAEVLVAEKAVGAAEAEG
jgi:hypothetical protein